MYIPRAGVRSDLTEWIVSWKSGSIFVYLVSMAYCSLGLGWCMQYLHTDLVDSSGKAENVIGQLP